ncbi:MAG: hypothetical protein JWN46_3756 [Acidimicrobiales bacterium]|nr:hypothetical protein [Acidimicrobiales bacterium]
MTSTTTASRPVRRLAPFAAAAALALTGCNYLWTPNQATALDRLTKDRAANRLSTLPIQSDAQNKAQAWAEKLSRDGVLSHSYLPDGIGVRWCSIGENVGYGPTITAIEVAYMASPHHRANILDSKWNGVGVGVARAGSRVYTVQVFLKTC